MIRSLLLTILFLCDMWAALVIGFLGGFHCLLMCGPLVIYLKHNRTNYTLRGFVTHQGSRLVGYAILGGLAGLIGFGFSLASLQRYLAVILGGLLLYAALSSLFSLPKLLGMKKMWRNTWLSTIYSKLSATSFIPLGLLNALLPCGLVYTALALSAAYFDPIKGAAFMCLFGLGTLPALGIVYIIPTSSVSTKSNLFRLVLPLTTALVGVLLILRGLGIGIPYISPNVEQLKVAPVGSQYECVQTTILLENNKAPLVLELVEGRGFGLML